MGYLEDLYKKAKDLCPAVKKDFESKEGQLFSNSSLWIFLRKLFFSGSAAGGCGFPLLIITLPRPPLLLFVLVLREPAFLREGAKVSRCAGEERRMGIGREKRR